MCRDGIDHMRTLESPAVISFGFVVGWWEVLGVVVGSVVLAGCPVEVELRLGDAILEPMISHVKGLGTFHANLGF